MIGYTIKKLHEMLGSNVKKRKTGRVTDSQRNNAMGTHFIVPSCLLLKSSDKNLSGLKQDEQ